MTVVRNHERRASRGEAAVRPEPKRLSQRELRDIVHRLDTREQTLQTAIAEERRRIDTEALSQLDAEVGDQVDQAFVMTSVEMERGLIDRYTQELERIAAVRERRAECSACVSTAASRSVRRGCTLSPPPCAAPIASGGTRRSSTSPAGPPSPRPVHALRPARDGAEAQRAARP